MTTFSENEKIQLLADIVELQTENNNEIDVCNYLKDLFDKYDIKSEILKVIDEYIKKDMYLKYIDIFKEASIQYLKEK